ncbi:MAG TPA: GAF domain-containing protein [Longimicrobiales bacterium]|nr:GAF domain-containing protein [Longimicrobiales bacterium]
MARGLRRLGAIANVLPLSGEVATMAATTLLSDGAGLPPDVRFALEALARVVERHSSDFRASVLLLSEDGRHILDCAGPHLPVEYRNAIHNLEIGEGRGSCGTAAYRNERVIVSDIATDPLWENYRDVALAHGLAACWSEPIRSSEGKVLGTFALYYDEPRKPTETDLNVIEAAALRAAAMIERAGTGASAEDLIRDLN